MKKLHGQAFVLLVFALSITGLHAQHPAFYNDIQKFKAKDSVQAPPKKPIVFVGSSSFTKWGDVQNYFPGYPILNRGFGGSSLPDVIRYAEDIIYPYKPKQVVIYCGENDFAVADTTSAGTVVQRVKTLFGMIRKNLGNVPVLFVSMKPSPNRRRFLPRMIQANADIKAFLSKEKKAAFADVYSQMLDTDGAPMKEIFLSDSLHMNAKGYVIWKRVLEPYLVK